MSTSDEALRFDTDAARLKWRGASSEKRKLIISSALDGKRVPEGEEGDLALGWAWVVLGPPSARRKARLRDYAMTIFMNTGLTGVSYWTRMGGGEEYDLVPVVRRAARAVEQVYSHE